MGKQLERIEVLKPALLKKYVFSGEDLKAIRKIGAELIFVTDPAIDHVNMGIARELVATAGTISRTGKENPALVYVLGGRSLDTKEPKFTFVESEDERAITLRLIEAMLVRLGKIGITVFDPSRT